jgi:hypothetical protein
MLNILGLPSHQSTVARRSNSFFSSSGILKNVDLALLMSSGCSSEEVANSHHHLLHYHALVVHHRDLKVGGHSRIKWVLGWNCSWRHPIAFFNGCFSRGLVCWIDGCLGFLSSGCCRPSLSPGSDGIFWATVIRMGAVPVPVVVATSVSILGATAISSSTAYSSVVGWVIG